MKVSIDATLCQGHTLCGLAAPEIFKFREDDGHAYVDNEDVPPASWERARLAAQTCPERAISLKDIA